MIHIEQLMAESGVKFGTSGARGLVRDMTDRVCWAYTRAFMQAVVPGVRRVALGHDLRPSSPAIAAACAAAISDAGAEVVFAGALPTPALAWYALREGMPAVVVTGSHIPFDRNGIKFYTAQGEIAKADEAAIAAAVVAEPSVATQALPPVANGVLDAYVARLRNFFPAGFLRGKRIAVYEHSSVARDVLPRVLAEFGAETISLGRTDEFVPVDTEAVSEADHAMARAWAAQHGFDAVLSTDGDADRPLIGDENGNWLRGDIVGLLCARHLGAQTVVTPVSSSTAIERCGAFANVVRTRIGSPYVIAGMDEALARGASGVVGFEANGGFLTGDTLRRAGRDLPPLPTRDAVLPMLCLLAAAGDAGVPLSGLAASLPLRFTASDRLQEFAIDRSRALLASLASPAAIEALWGELCGPAVGVDWTDGCRVSFANDDIAHLRPSGNAPELRCYAEASTPQRAAALVTETLQRVRNA